MPFADAPPLLGPGAAVSAVADVGVTLPLEEGGVVDELRARGGGLLLLPPAGDPPLRAAAGTPALLLLGIVLGPAAGVEYASAGVLRVSVVEELKGVETLLLLVGKVPNVVVAIPDEAEVLLLEVAVLCCCMPEVGAEALVLF